MNSPRMAMLGLVMLALFAVDGQLAKADDGHASFVVQNPNKVAMRYQVKWGDGDLKSTTVPAGGSWNHWNHYYSPDANGRAPPAYNRFDAVAGNNEVTNKSYKLGLCATHGPSEDQ